MFFHGARQCSALLEVNHSFREQTKIQISTNALDVFIRTKRTVLIHIFWLKRTRISLRLAFLSSDTHSAFDAWRVVNVGFSIDHQISFNEQMCTMTKENFGKQYHFISLSQWNFYLSTGFLALLWSKVANVSRIPNILSQCGWDAGSALFYGREVFCCVKTTSVIFSGKHCCSRSESSSFLSLQIVASKRVFTIVNNSCEVPTDNS